MEDIKDNIATIFRLIRIRCVANLTGVVRHKIRGILRVSIAVASQVPKTSRIAIYTTRSKRVA